MLLHNFLSHSQVFFNFYRDLPFSVATKFYHFLAVIVAIENFFVATPVLPSNLNYVATRNSLSLLFLCFSSASCHDKEFTSFMFFFFVTEIIFVATEIVLLLL